MRKNKIAAELSGYFAAALLIFSVIIGTIFIFLSQKLNVERTERELEYKASRIASTVAVFLDGIGTRSFPPPRGMDFRSYIDNLNELSMCDVWIVDKNLNIFTSRKNMNEDFQYMNLPKDAEDVIKTAFKGTTSANKSFNSVLSAKALTVGSPIVSSDGETIGVVLLHSPVSGTSKSIEQGITILAVSIFIALVLSVLISVKLSLNFTKPLNLMKQSALKLADGDYSAKTGIERNDEIGELAQILDELSVRLDKASRESENLEKLRREYVANISHELKTPITVIRGSLEALCDGIITDAEMVNDYHMQMLSESKGLERLVADLLELSRLQNPDFAIEMAPLNLCDVVKDIQKSCIHLAKEKNVQIISSVPEYPCAIFGDYGRIRQLVMIIADNAIKFSPENGTVKIVLEEKPDGYELSIEDNGKGISEQDLPYVFERFYKTKSPENKNGTGLGLAIAKEIALRHGARLFAQSNEESNRTVFTAIFKKCPQNLLEEN
jgi:signal transduction histidine kinase